MREMKRRPAGGESESPRSKPEEARRRYRRKVRGDSPRRWVCLFFGLLLAAGFFTAPAYGIPWDEPDERDILRMNLWEYCNLLGIDDSVFQDLAAERRREPALNPYISLLTPISQNVHRDHGAAAYYPLAGIVMSRNVSPAGQRLIWHLYTWLLFWLGAVALYQSCRHVSLSRPMSCLGAAMLMLSPRFFAEGHYNNKDIVLMVFVLLMLWQALRLAKKPAFGAGALFALAGALAACTKIAGWAVFCLCGAFVAASLLAKKQMNPGNLWIGAATVGCFLLFYAVLTPSLWRDPLGFVEYLIGNAVSYTVWQGFVLFRGAVFDTSLTLLPRYYLPYMMLTTTPLWIAGLSCFGQIEALRAALMKKNRNRMAWLLISLLWLVPLGFAVLTRTRIYNGWRHFYFLYGPLLVLAAYGASRLWERAKGRKGLRRAGAGLLAACMGVTGFSMAMNHPYQYVYYNPIPRLVTGGKMNAYLERDYWNVSVADALVRLARTEELRSADHPVYLDGVDLWSRQGVRAALDAYPEETGMLRLAGDGEDLRESDYRLVNRTYQNFSHWRPPPGAKPVVAIMAYGEELAAIYRVDHPGLDSRSGVIFAALPDGADNSPCLTGDEASL
ncbi:MAG: hypothetical protein FWF86_07680 [Clostridia bacterium]|nr:hypothetical protein [Clostridia bacterium]